MTETQEREVYFKLKTTENEVNGFPGCNAFNRNYTVKNDSLIYFSSMATTRKDCSDVDFIEAEFLKVFDLADKYTIKGDTLSLNVERRAPITVLSRFILIKNLSSS